MIKKFIKKRLTKYSKRHSIISQQDIQNSNTILFSIFSRYGDGIISFKIINEFIKKYPQKKYILLTSRQQIPYATKIITNKNIKFLKVNKYNPIELFKTVFYLKKSAYDLGFNPWGHGDDSEFFITYCKKFTFYKQCENFSKVHNLYDRVRSYLDLPIIKNKEIINPSFTKIKQILIAPISTDITKNLSEEDTNLLLEQLKEKFNDVKIILALPKNNMMPNVNTKKFTFGKSTSNSKQFLNTLLASDLFIGVDSGPLHLAMALDIECIGIFGPTSPNTILDNNTKIKILRDNKLMSTFCFVRNCKKPICINNIFNKNIFNDNYKIGYNITLEETQCPIE